MRTRVLVLFLLLGAAPVRAAVDAPDGFELILLDGYEDCPLAYRDVDLDTYGGDSDVRIVCGPPPAGFVALGGDCDDSNPAIRPGAAETVPDAQFADENCDGVDGNAALAIFVAVTGSAAAGCGSRSLPCSLGVAFARAQTAGLTQLYVQRGNYATALRLEAVGGALAVFGGYGADWRRAPRTVNPTTILGGTDASIGAFAVQLASGAYGLFDLIVQAPGTASRSGAGDGLGSYGIRIVNGAIATVLRVDVSSGSGADGATSSDGASASLVQAQDGGVGGSGAEFPTFCDDDSFGAAGQSGTNATCGSGRPNGGAGGRGGTMDEDCGNPLSLQLDAQPGVAGVDAATPVGANGQGGSAGSGVLSCGPTTGGTAGFVDDGNAGAAVGNPDGRLTLAGLSSTWLGFPGNAGDLGLDGTGGGGGGGAGGCDSGTDSSGAGGGGGGAGGCRASLAGGGGSPGGGSIAIFVLNSTLSIQDANVARGSGGDGGDGGQGGLGQAGGDGGPVGAHPGGALAGTGGAGARGGHSGAGSGGPGGISVGLFSFQATVVNQGGVAHASSGTSGSGGAGGTIGVAAPPGPPGTSGSTLTCSTATGC